MCIFTTWFWHILQLILFKYHKCKKLFFQVPFCIGPWFGGITVDELLNYLLSFDCILLISGAAVRYCCTPTMSAHLRRLAVQDGSTAVEPLQHLFVAPLIYFLGWFGNSRHGARRLTRRDEYRGNKRQTEWCELNCVFIAYYFPPQKVVIGINYQTGANSDDSHDLAVCIDFASRRR